MNFINYSVKKYLSKVDSASLLLTTERIKAIPCIIIKLIYNKTGLFYILSSVGSAICEQI